MQPSLVSQYRRLATARQQCGYRYWDMLWESVVFRFALVFTVSLTVGLTVLLLPFHNLKIGSFGERSDPKAVAVPEWNIPATIHIGEMRRGLSSPVTIEVKQHEAAPTAPAASEHAATGRPIEVWPGGWQNMVARGNGRFRCWGSNVQIWSLDLLRPYAHLHCPTLT
ncbi:MAG: hypothetical protein JWL93_2393 [Hyphomicrobiales bacterium]|jgi:hypothetical protein|nr:hypothetical protein [Hyphomicrobiales bacterium]